MRLLFITNFYPPFHRGGFEEWCQEVAQGLRNSGHDVTILTSTYRNGTLKTPEPLWVRRELLLEMEFSSFRNALVFFTSRKKREAENLTCLAEIMKKDNPDAILVWGMWNLPRSLAALAEESMPGRVAYYMGDYWPTLPSQLDRYWDSSARNMLTILPKLLLKRVAKKILANEKKTSLCLDHVFFPSRFMRNEFERLSIIPQVSRIIYGAIDTAPFLTYSKNWQQKDVTNLLYIGRLVPEKGVHTAIEALGYMLREYAFKSLYLTIVGNGNPDYVDGLHQLAKREGVESFVTFLPVQPKEALPALYQRADLFLFTSIWPEPFGRVIVEAMASGVPVIGSPVGGAAEILQDNDNALIFAADDPVSLGQQIRRLVEAPSLRAQLGQRGREWARSKFDLCRMTNEIESSLQDLIH